MHRYGDWRGFWRSFTLSFWKIQIKYPSQWVRPLYSHQCSAAHLLDKLQFGLNVQFLTFPLVQSVGFCWEISQGWCGLGLVLPLGPAWLWVNLLAAIWFDGLPLTQIYGMGTCSSPAAGQSDTHSCSLQENPSLLPRVQNFPASSHKQCHKALSDSSVVFASPFQSSLLIRFVWKCLNWL